MIKMATSPLLLLGIQVFQTRSAMFHLPLLILGAAAIIGLLLVVLYVAGLMRGETLASAATVLIIMTAFLILVTWGGAMILRRTQRISMIDGRPIVQPLKEGSRKRSRPHSPSSEGPLMRMEAATHQFATGTAACARSSTTRVNACVSMS